MEHSEFIVYGTALSGHTHRVELLLAMLELPYRRELAPAEVRRGAAFLRLNPLGQIPVLEHDGLVLADSNAILVYLARRYAPGSHWLPDEPLAAAQIQRWLSIAAGELMVGPAVARMIALGTRQGDAAPAVDIARRLLAFMEQHLSTRAYLATEEPTIADLACYSYIAHAPEGGIALEAYPAVRAWLGKIEALPHFFDLPASPLAQPR